VVDLDCRPFEFVRHLYETVLFLEDLTQPFSVSSIFIMVFKNLRSFKIFKNVDQEFILLAAPQARECKSKALASDEGLFTVSSDSRRQNTREGKSEKESKSQRHI
jgi:hypothetical protein